MFGRRVSGGSWLWRGAFRGSSGPAQGQVRVWLHFLRPGVAHEFRLQAFNSLGPSAFSANSNPLSVQVCVTY